MRKQFAISALAALVLLAACSKQPETASPPAGAPADDEAAPPAAAAPAETSATDSPANRASRAAGMMGLIDTAPNCQSFRDQLDAAGKAPADPMNPDDLSKIVAAAHDAGCGRKAGTP